jgi:hypothetical protein
MRMIKGKRVLRANKAAIPMSKETNLSLKPSKKKTKYCKK